MKEENIGTKLDALAQLYRECVNDVPLEWKPIILWGVREGLLNMSEAMLAYRVCGLLNE